MICIRCGHSNPETTNYCQKCNASIPRLAMQSAPGSDSILSVEEGYNYMSPQKSYATEYMYNLTCRAHEYINQAASGDPLLEAYNVVKTKFEEFEQNALPDTMQGLISLANEQPNDTYPKQMKYLLHKGTALYREGMELMDKFIASGSNDDLTNAIYKMQEGNDYIGLALEFTEQIEAVVGPVLEEINRRMATAKASEGQQQSASAPAPSTERASQRSSSATLDKTQPI